MKRNIPLLSALALVITLPGFLRADILVDLDATALSEGPLATWTNNGTETGDFNAETDVPNVQKIGVATGVTLNGVSNWYVGPIAPASVTGNNSRSVEAWVYNPAAAPEETVFAWARRGGPDGTNIAFNHGTHDAFGALGQWGNGPDVGWDSIEDAGDSQATGDDQERVGEWTYIVYTYDGVANTTAVYTNGLSTRADVNGPMNAHSLADDGFTTLPFLVGNQNEPNGTRTGALSGSMTIARVRAHDEALPAAAVEAQFNAEAPVFNLVPTAIVDSEPDGLDDNWEMFHFGDLDELPGDDPDTDGLTTADEHDIHRTFPNATDTDGDGADDGEEVNRFDDGQPAPTNPFDPDSDDDGLTDGYEIDQSMTDPLDVDSDDDGFTDAQEDDAGSDPNDPNEVPALPAIISLDATQLAPGPLMTWTNTGTAAGDFTAEIDVPNVETFMNATDVNGVTLDGTNDWYVGPEAPITVTGNNSRTIEAWVQNPTIDSEETVFAWGRRGGPDGTNMSFNHGTHDGFGAVGHWGGGPDVGWDSQQDGGDDQAGGDDQEEADVWSFISYVYDGSANTTSVYTNGILTRSDVNGPFNTHALADDNLTSLPFVVGNQNDANGTRTDGLSGSMAIAKINVFAEPLTATLIAKHYDDDAPSFGRARINIVDSEPDGLDDDYEMTFFGDLDEIGTGDFDNDGLDNAGEHALFDVRVGPLFVDPTEPDSDSDGVSDGDEVHRMDGGQPAPTNLLDPDSDDDGLTDGEEVDEMTDPLDPDSDDDGFSDKSEVDAGTDPNNPNSFPTIAVPDPVHRYSFEETGGAGTVLLDSIGSADGTIVDQGVNDATVGGGVLSMTGGAKDASDYADFPDGIVTAAAASGTAGDMTVEVWGTTLSAQNWSRVFSFGSATDNVMHMSWTRGTNTAQNEFRWNQGGQGLGNLTVQDFGPNILSEESHWSVVFDDDGGATGQTNVKIYFNGAEVASNDTALDVATLGDSDVWLGRSQWGDNTANADYNEFRLYDVALSSDEVTASFAQGPDVAGGGPARFEITSIAVQPGGIVVTWNSVPNASYAIDTSSDLTSWNEFSDFNADGREASNADDPIPIPVEPDPIHIRIRDIALQPDP